MPRVKKAFLSNFGDSNITGRPHDSEGAPVMAENHGGQVAAMKKPSPLRQITDVIASGPGLKKQDPVQPIKRKTLNFIYFRSDTPAPGPHTELTNTPATLTHAPQASATRPGEYAPETGSPPHEVEGMAPPRKRIDFVDFRSDPAIDAIQHPSAPNPVQSTTYKFTQTTPPSPTTPLLPKMSTAASVQAVQNSSMYSWNPVPSPQTMMTTHLNAVQQNTTPSNAADARAHLGFPESVAYWHVPGRERPAKSTLSAKEWRQQEAQSGRTHRQNEEMFGMNPALYRQVVWNELRAFRPANESANEIAIYFVKANTTAADARAHGRVISAQELISIFLAGINGCYPDFVREEREKIENYFTLWNILPSMSEVMLDLVWFMSDQYGRTITKELFGAIDAIRPTKKALMVASAGAEEISTTAGKRKHQEEEDAEEHESADVSSPPWKKPKLDASQSVTVDPTARAFAEPAFTMPPTYPTPPNAMSRLALNTMFAHPPQEITGMHHNALTGEQQRKRSGDEATSTQTEPTIEKASDGCNITEDALAAINAIRPTVEFMVGSGAQKKATRAEKRKHDQEYESEQMSYQPQKKARIDAPQAMSVYPPPITLPGPAFNSPPYPAPPKTGHKTDAGPIVTHPPNAAAAFHHEAGIGDKQRIDGGHQTMSAQIQPSIENATVTAPKLRPFLASRKRATKQAITTPAVTENPTTSASIGQRPTHDIAAASDVSRQAPAKSSQSSLNVKTATGSLVAQMLLATPNTTAATQQPSNATSSTNLTKLNANTRLASLLHEMAAAETELPDWKPLRGLKFDTASLTPTSDRLFRTPTPEMTEEEFWGGGLYRGLWSDRNVKGKKKEGPRMVFPSLMDAAWAQEKNAGW